MKRKMIELELSKNDAREFCTLAASKGLTVSELLEGFICDLIEGEKTSGSDERQLAAEYLERRCSGQYSGRSYTLLQYLLEEQIAETYSEAIQSIKELKRLQIDAEAIRKLTEWTSEVYEEYASECDEMERQPKEQANKYILQWYKEYRMLQGEEISNRNATISANKKPKTAEHGLTKDFYTIYEVADLLHFHHNTIRRAIKNGELKAAQLNGREWRITKEDLQAYIKG